MKELIDFLNDELQEAESIYDLSHDFVDIVKRHLKSINSASNESMLGAGIISKLLYHLN